MYPGWTALAAAVLPWAAAAQPAPPARPPGDPLAAVQAEFEAARRAGTAAAWDAFLARHPDSPLAPKARAAREGAGR